MSERETGTWIPENHQVAVALRVAVHGGDVSAIRELLRDELTLATARLIGGRGGSGTALHLVTDWPGYVPNGPQIVRLLIDADAGPNALTTSQGSEPGPGSQTPLHYAAGSDDADVTEALLDGGADLEVPGGSIGTALDNAVGYGCWHVARLPVARGALTGSTHRYLQFLPPGTLVMAVLPATMYTGINLNTDLGKGVYDRFRTLPMWRPDPIVGALLGDTLRYLLASTLVIGLGLILGFRPHGGVAGVALGAALVVVFASALSWVFYWLGLVLPSPNAVMNLAFLVLFPLTMTSNTFVDPHTMPGWLRRAVDANPVTHLVSATRDAMAGTATAGQVAGVLVISTAATAGFASLTLRAYGRAS